MTQNREDLHAGPCLSGRHSWGKEVNVQRGISFWVSHQRCRKCSRIRVREYTNRGNHIRGYITKEAP